MKALTILPTLVALASCATSSPIVSEAVYDQIGSSPSLNTQTTVDVGEAMVEQFQYLVHVDAQLKDGYEARFALGKIAAPNGTFLMGYRDSTSANQFCSSEKLYRDPLVGGYDVICFKDINNDERFDLVRVPRIALGSWKELKADPLRYERIIADAPVDSGQGFKHELLYQGLSKGTIKVAYREYVNNMARPAFSQIVEYEYGGEELEISFKGARILIHSATQNNITYTVSRGFNL
jgi:hypothetical protein